MSKPTFRRQLLLSTTMIVGALTGYGRGAYAQCVDMGGANFVCSGANLPSQDLAASNATITTLPGFSVNAPTGNALAISGDGFFVYTDENASPLTSNAADTDALFVQSEADSFLGPEGSVTISTGGVLNGARDGLVARNYGSGSINVTADGNVTGGAAGRGIFAANGSDLNPSGRDIVVTTGADATITAGRQAILVDNRGDGITRVIANGNVTSTYSDAINAGGGTSIEITTAAGKTIDGDQYGIVVGGASGSITITANGIVMSGELDGISAEITSGDDDIEITTGAESSVIGTNRGINARSYAGAVNITVNGEVTGNSSDGIFSRHYYGGDINIEVGTNSDVSGDNGFAVNTYGSTTLIVAGRLSGDSGAVEFDQGEILDDRVELRPTAEVNGDVLAGPGDDTLAFGGSGDGAFSLSNIDTGGSTEQFQDFETFVVESATWTMNGVTSADFIVEGGTVKGNGTFGDLTVNGGTLSPGNSFGTMTVNGVFSLNPGATLEVEVNAAGQGDQVIVNGPVNLTGSVLRVLAVDGNYKAKTEYVIIDNDDVDPVVGVFGTITSNLAFLIPTVIYDGGDGNDVVLTLLRTSIPGGDDDEFVSFCSVAETQNQCNVAHALDNFPTSNALFLAVLTQTAEGARQAFDALSGEIHATTAGVLADDNRYVREAILGRMMQANHTDGALAAGGPQVASLDDQAFALGYDGKSLVAPERAPLAFWTRAYGAWGNFDTDGNAATADRDLGGFVSGMDASVGGSWRAGLATGASFSNIDVDARFSSANVESYYLGGYLGGMAGGFALRGGGTWAWSDIDTSRAVIFPGFFERQKASYDANTGQLFGEVAYPTQMGSMALEPFGGLAFVSVDTDNFREHGGPLASLRGVNTDQDVGYTSLGLRAATTMMLGSMQVVPHISAAWLHAFDDVTPGASLAFATTGIGFAIDGVPLAEDSALLDAGLDFALSENATAGVSYTGQFGDDVTDNGVKGRFTWLF